MGPAQLFCNQYQITSPFFSLCLCQLAVVEGYTSDDSLYEHVLDEGWLRLGLDTLVPP